MGQRVAHQSGEEKEYNLQADTSSWIKKKSLDFKSPLWFYVQDFRKPQTDFQMDWGAWWSEIYTVVFVAYIVL